MADLSERVDGGLIAALTNNFGLWDVFEAGGVGLSALKLARFEFDFDEEDHAAEPADNKDVGAHPVGVSLPQYAIIVGGFYDVNTAFDSGTDAATVAIHVEGANDILSALVVANAGLGTIGRKAIIPKFTTPESTSVKTTVARAITVTVAEEALTAGKLTGYLYWLPGVKSE